MSPHNIITKLKESRDPKKGIFWFIDRGDSDHIEILYLDIPDDPDFRGNSKNGMTYTHEKTWKDLVSSYPSDIRNKPWNHYPRGRVELHNNRAIIYLNPNIYTPECQKDIIDAFNLQKLSTRFISDGSSHYKCHLDQD